MVIWMGYYTWKEEAEESESDKKMWSWKQNLRVIQLLTFGRVLWANEYWQPLESGKDKKRDYLLEAPQVMPSSQHLDFSPF